jgi:hypothetical protein
MAITFDTLKSYMPAIGLVNHEHAPSGDKEGRITAGFAFDTKEPDYPEAKVGVLISLQENGEYIQIRFFQIIDRNIKIMESPYLKEFILYVMKLNHVTKIGRWCLDQDDGDFYIDWAIGIEDNDRLTENQLKRMMRGLVSSLRMAYAPMHRILKTGNANPPKSRDDIIKEILLKLTQSEKYELIPKVVGINDLGRLRQIEEFLLLEKFSEAVHLINQ